ncbi:alpha/beta fold hydrolase, partial [Aeromicrobium sp.]
MHVRQERFDHVAAARTRTRALVAVAVAGVAGAVSGWLIPRGPVTTGETLSAVVAALAVGFATGWLMRSRWAMLIAPVTFMMVFELARMRVDGPTVDGIRLDGIYGVIALIGGRGVDALLMLLPMVVGVAFGVVVTKRSESPPDPAHERHLVRRGVLALATLAVVALVAGLLRPASTEKILGADGEPVVGSVAEIVDVRIGGHDQAIMLRGVSAEAPVLLYLEGGPGGTGLGRIRNSGDDLEQDFMVATWDQRGTGKSYDSLEPRSTLTVDQMVDDTLAVVNYLRDRFDQQKIYLVG